MTNPKITSKIEVKYIDHMGNDLSPVNAARISFGNKKTELDDKDRKLLKYLAKHKHMTPYEHSTITILIKCPLYIRSQIHRHRTFSYNEISRRYTSKDLEFYLPKGDDIRMQSSNNKQASEGLVENETKTAFEVSSQKIYSECLKAYDRAIFSGVCREQARGLLPQTLMTEFYMTGNLRNFVHFLNLRLAKDSQKEVQYVAKGIDKILKKLYPISYEILKQYN